MDGPGALSKPSPAHSIIGKSGENIKKSVEERFWSKVRIGNHDQCWPWTGATDKDGYGRFRLNKTKQVKAHVYAKLTNLIAENELLHHLAMTPPEEVFDLIDRKGVQYCHTCDNPPCCNPDHLFVGNALTNAQDRDSKNRGKSTLRSVRHSYFSFPREIVVEVEADFYSDVQMN